MPDSNRPSGCFPYFNCQIGRINWSRFGERQGNDYEGDEHFMFVPVNHIQWIRLDYSL